jgi:hypothetical protein
LKPTAFVTATNVENRGPAFRETAGDAVAKLASPKRVRDIYSWERIVQNTARYIFLEV